VVKPGSDAVARPDGGAADRSSADASDRSNSPASAAQESSAAVVARPRAGGTPKAGDTPNPNADAWLEMAVTCDPEAVEVVSEILSRVAPGGISVEPAFTLVDEGLGAAVDPTRPATVRAYLPAREPAAAEAATREVERAIGHLQAFGLGEIGVLRATIVHETDWATAWKRHVGVMRIGRRVVIRPTWRRHRRREGDVVIAMDPGMAFGTGLHPTTRLCLAGIERWADAGVLARGGARDGTARFLDVGCGSGILGIAAGMMGAGDLVGLDTDPIAVEATEANARRNGLARRLRARRGTLPSGEAPFDLVVANLIASLLVALAGDLAAELHPGGRLLASGIFVDREGDVRDSFALAGLRVVGRDGEGDWVALDAEREL
jgi:ribosomal protein L11 methyltransferase